MMILAIIVVAAFAAYVMTSDERRQTLVPVFVFLRKLGLVMALGLVGLREFLIALLARKPWALAGLGAMAALVLAGTIQALYEQQLTDIRPEIERVIVIEARTVQSYEAAVNQFKLGAMSAEALAKMIKRTVLPELQATRLRLKSLDLVPPEHKPLLARTDEYLQLRNESWRLRADALEKRSLAALKKADHAERASLQAFEHVRPPEMQ
jgi:hypothetical protein